MKHGCMRHTEKPSGCKFLDNVVAEASSESHTSSVSNACRKKIPSEEPVFHLAAVELVKTDTPIYHISRYLPLVRRSSAPFSFVLSFTLPYARKILTMVLIFEADEAYGGAGQKGTSSDEDSEDDSQLSPFDVCLARCDFRLLLR
jgi:hypothetical protein